MNAFDNEDEIFYDLVDDLPSHGSVDVLKDSLHSNLGFGIWLNEPESVEKRRGNFLREMGLVSSAISRDQVIDSDSETRRMGNSCAVTSFSSSLVDVNTAEENMLRHIREHNRESNCGIEDFVQDVSTRPNLGYKVATENATVKKKKLRKWWRSLLNKSEKIRGAKDVNKEKRVKVRYCKKRSLELSGVFLRQELRAHVGLIWSMKFSPDGQFLATGGEDGVVRVWRVSMVDACCSKDKSKSRDDKWSSCKTVIPGEIFQIEESPIHQFWGHTGDVLDVAWSESNRLLSSSKDKTVRLWQVGYDQCLHVFEHNDYVTCIQFNPCDEKYFLSGSIDGKLRVWGVSKERVIDWADVRDVITAISYQPDGKGILAGSVTGTCSFFDASDGNIVFNARVRLRGRQKSSGNKITAIQFCRQNSQRVIITSEDSKVRILDGTEIVQKYKGRARSGTQMSASITSSGKHIISVGEDSHVYMWNYDELTVASSKHSSSSRSCEHFFSEGVSLAVPWSGMESKLPRTEHVSSYDCSVIQGPNEVSSWRKDSAYFSLPNWLSIDGSYRNSATWPEEKLPNCDAKNEFYTKGKFSPETWGLVIVTAGWDGVIRTFHNYGFPIDVSQLRVSNRRLEVDN